MIRRIASLGLALSIQSVANKYESPDLKGLMIEVTKPPKAGCTVRSAKDDYVEIHYTTFIAESSKAGEPGKQIDTSRDADELNDPMSFQLGGLRVIPGWDWGVRDMCEGEIRMLTVPPEHAYGEEGYSQTNADKEEVAVPPGASLRIEAELIKIIRLEKRTKFKPDVCDAKAKPSDKIKVHYTLWIHKSSVGGEKGSMVESSHDSGEPMEFTLGGGRVIPAWDQGLVDVCVGEKLTLVAPPEFAYGEKGSGDKVPPMATLEFAVEVLEITEDNMFNVMDTNHDGKIDIEELGVFMEQRQGLKDPEAIKEIFESEDKNKDGFIDWEEAPFPKGNRPSGSPSSGGSFEQSASTDSPADDSSAEESSEEDSSNSKRGKSKSKSEEL